MCCVSDENTALVQPTPGQEEQLDESVQQVNSFKLLINLAYLMANLIKVGSYTGNGNSETFQDLNV